MLYEDLAIGKVTILNNPYAHPRVYRSYSILDINGNQRWKSKNLQFLNCYIFLKGNSFWGGNSIILINIWSFFSENSGFGGDNKYSVGEKLAVFALLSFSSVQFSCSVVSKSLRPHELCHARPPCPSQTPGVHSDSRPLSQWCHPAISSSVVLPYADPK